MSLRVQRSEWFVGDLEHYAAWYDREAGWEIAERYLKAVAATLARLAETPTLGHRTAFDALELGGLRCQHVEKPFQKHLIFYRFNETTLSAERAVHGARDLPRRLVQPPGAELE
jgi:toxin ParE1/3/4